MTRVLMTADAVGGVWTYAVELADALARHGVATTIATMGRAPSPAQRAAAAAHDLRESTFALEWTDDPWRDVDAAGEWLLGLAAEVRPDVVHLNGYAHAALPWPAPVVVVAHSDVLSWFRAVRGTEAPAEWDEYRRRLARGLDAAGALVAPTRAVLDGMGRDGVVIPNARSASWVRAVPKEPFVLAAGRAWDEAKNVAALRRVALPWPLVVAEDRPFAEVAGLLCRAAVFAHPARYEPFGLASLEAGLAGCALVLGDVPSLREVWGDAAVYADPADDAALAALLGSLAEDPAAVRDLGARARARALTYSPERQAVAYLAVYAGLAGARGAA
ncbi:MAG TPA: glycosyltransferase [Mycobacteriales bacterium]|jgi:hypothetical protein|nr:glycosyltransferase [Mycobacteriales bacterium]